MVVPDLTRFRGRMPALLGVAATIALGATLLLAWDGRPDSAAGPCVVVSGPSRLPEIAETSGLAVSRRDRSLLWSHNDSGNAGVLFALDSAGALRGRVRVPIRARDWEDVSAARCPSGNCLYIADIGDNQRARRQVQIFRVTEPAPGDAETTTPELFTAKYADGRHNAEAMFVIGSDLFIVTKDRIGGVYRATISSGRDLMFQPVGQLGLNTVTDAESSPDEQTVAVRNLTEVVLYNTADVLRGHFVPYLRIPIDGLKEPQGEGIAFDGDRLFLSSERRSGGSGGTLLSLRCEWPQ